LPRDDGVVTDGSGGQARLDVQDFPRETPLIGTRLNLEPLRVEHAEEMALLLDDPDLHTFIGGEPANLADLRDRYRRQTAGRSADGHECWLNWVVRRRVDGLAIGTVQATVAQDAHGFIAELAWIIATPYQGRGYAREAAGTMLAWLRQQGVAAVVAHVHPDHHASQRVAHAIGLTATTTEVDGEIRWQG
jgi:RimJ/RimL family protein N-acetyltransferase